MEVKVRCQLFGYESHFKQSKKTLKYRAEMETKEKTMQTLSL